MNVYQKDICKNVKCQKVYLRQQEHFQERKLPKGCMAERRLQECQMSKGLFGDKTFDFLAKLEHQGLLSIIYLCGVQHLYETKERGNKR